MLKKIINSLYTFYPYELNIKGAKAIVNYPTDSIIKEFIIPDQTFYFSTYNKLLKKIIKLNKKVPIDWQPKNNIVLTKREENKQYATNLAYHTRLYNNENKGFSITYIPLE